jgi:hypothetical protein
MPAADALRKLLHTKKAPAAAAAAAGAAGKSSLTGQEAGAASSPSKQQAAAAAAAGGEGGPWERYAAAFRQLGAAEQRRRVEGLSRLSLGELESMEVLQNEAKEALFMVGGGWVGGWGGGVKGGKHWGSMQLVVQSRCSWWWQGRAGTSSGQCPVQLEAHTLASPTPG